MVLFISFCCRNLCIQRCGGTFLCMLLEGIVRLSSVAADGSYGGSITLKMIFPSLFISAFCKYRRVAVRKCPNPPDRPKYNCKILRLIICYVAKLVSFSAYIKCWSSAS